MNGRIFLAGLDANQAALLQNAGLLPEDARGRPWLVPLLRGYLLLEKSLAADLARDGRPPACARGCDECCHQPIPVTPPEILGMALYLKRRGRPEPKGRALADGCVFLENGACLVYPLRPIACRRYMIFGRRCAPGEHPAISRPADVLWPSTHALLHVLRETAVYYEHLGLLPKQAKPNMDFFQGRTLLLHEVDWPAFGKE